VTDGNGKVTTYTWTARRDAQTVRDPLGNLTTYAYDANRLRTSAQDPKGSVTAFTYDTRDRLTRITQPGNGRGGVLGGANVAGYTTTVRIASAGQGLDQIAVTVTWTWRGREQSATILNVARQRLRP
jgi:YD repeat-containing protein